MKSYSLPQILPTLLLAVWSSGLTAAWHAQSESYVHLPNVLAVVLKLPLHPVYPHHNSHHDEGLRQTKQQRNTKFQQNMSIS